jgi:hypothetical protein
VCIILDDNEVSSDEDEPLQKQLFGARLSSIALTEAAATMAVADKEAIDRRATEEAVVKRAAEESAVNVVADDEVTGKTVNEATGVAGDSPALGQAPSVART